MKFLNHLAIILFSIYAVYGQNSIEASLQKYNNQTVPYSYAADLDASENIVFLDAREKEEYNVSHLKNALWVGHKTFKKDEVLSTLKNKAVPIVVYCSIGVRSEDIAEKLITLGYTNVKNLYGGIFEWKNKSYPVFDIHENETNKVHAYNKEWGKLLTKGEKVYSKKNH